MLLYEVRDQRLEVRQSFPKRWNADRENVEPVQQICAEISRCSHLG